MSKNAVAQFFSDVYKDRKLQGALHYALAKSAPDVVVEIAKEKGYSFTSEDLASVVEAGSVEVKGSAASPLSSRSLSTRFWSGVIRHGGTASDFRELPP
jgi:predicted ribosomally synthesized peptide with nif11-like leader